MATPVGRWRLVALAAAACFSACASFAGLPGTDDGAVPRDGGATDATRSDGAPGDVTVRSDAPDGARRHPDADKTLPDRSSPDAGVADVAVGDGARSDASDVGAPLGRVIEVTAGVNHTCALLPDGSVSCWGQSLHGQLGAAVLTDAATPEPVAIDGLSGVVKVVAGGYHTCALLGDGTVKCWGYNVDGEVGNGSRSPSLVAPTKVTLPAAVISLAAGTNHTCALMTGGSVACWGSNAYGQLCNGSTIGATSPQPAMGSGVIALTGGVGHTCMLMTGGTVECCGDDMYDELGRTLDAGTAVPVPAVVPGLTNVEAITSHGWHTCALITGGAIRCWGRNNAGQLGDDSIINRTVPVGVQGLPDAAAIAVRVGDVHSCALFPDGSIMCWGAGGSGQLGDHGLSPASSLVPVTVGVTAGVPFAISSALDAGIPLVAGNGYTCGVLADGTVDCWGQNMWGELGNGGTASAYVPVPVVW